MKWKGMKRPQILSWMHELFYCGALDKIHVYQSCNFASNFAQVAKLFTNCSLESYLRAVQKCLQFSFMR